jgi:hypothetical protein
MGTDGLRREARSSRSSVREDATGRMPRRFQTLYRWVGDP